jgi:hypothetical protein
MGPAVAAFALFALLIQSTNVSAHDMTLTLPHPLAAGEIAWLEVQVGPIGRGQEIEVTTAAGQKLGTISPFSVRGGPDAGTYTLPVPGDAIRNGRLSVRLTISRSDAPPRAPTAREVPSVKLIVPGASR